MADYLPRYATEIDVHFVRKSVRAIGKLAIKIESAARPCIDTLLELVATKVSYIVQEATVVIKNIFRKYPNRFETVISKLCENLDSLDEPEAKAAMIWIIGQYADRIENSELLLDDFLDSFREETYEVQLALLTATVKLFIQRPTKGAELVPKVLKWATEESDHPDLRERGFFYWRLLSYNDPAASKLVVMGEKPRITAESEKLTLLVLEEMCLHVGTLATIYLKPVNQIFRSARIRRLEESPALQRTLQGSSTTMSTGAHDNSNISKGVGNGASHSNAYENERAWPPRNNLAAAVDAADEYFANLGSGNMADLHIADDNLASPMGGVPGYGSMMFNAKYHQPQVNHSNNEHDNDDLLLL